MIKCSITSTTADLVGGNLTAKADITEEVAEGVEVLRAALTVTIPGGKLFGTSQITDFIMEKYDAYNT